MLNIVLFVPPVILFASYYGKLVIWRTEIMHELLLFTMKFLRIFFSNALIVNFQAGDNFPGAIIAIIPGAIFVGVTVLEPSVWTREFRYKQSLFS